MSLLTLRVSMKCAILTRAMANSQLFKLNAQKSEGASESSRLLPREIHHSDS